MSSLWQIQCYNILLNFLHPCSVFALATDEELEESLREWREKIDGGTADQFMEEYEGRRRKIGLTTSVIAHKQWSVDWSIDYEL